MAKCKQRAGEIKLHRIHSTKAKQEDDVKIETHRTYGILPQEMIRDILTRLPVKSLIRFNCLSKGFNNLFLSPNFIAEHLHFSNRSPSLFFDVIHGSSILESPTLYVLPGTRLCSIGNRTKLTHLVGQPFSIDGDFMQIEGSSNGLLCLTTRRHILIWNPATKQVSRIPESNYVVRSFVCGFGFNSVVNDYKVVLIHREITEGAEVYSLKSGAWKQFDVAASSLGLNNASHYSYQINNLITTNGSCFGVVTQFKKETFAENTPKYFPKWILCFDLGVETFTKITLPDLLVNNDHIKLAPYEDSIALIVYPESNDYMVDIWVYIKCGDYWTRLYSVPNESYRVQGVWRDKVLIIDQESEKKALISTFNGEENEILATHESEFAFRFFKAYDYVESLVLI